MARTSNRAANFFIQMASFKILSPRVYFDQSSARRSLKHTFEGSFDLLSDSALADKEYDKYIGRKVFTLYKTDMKLEDGTNESIPRLTGFEIKAMHVLGGTHYVKMTLDRDGKLYTKQVTFQQESVIGDLAGEHEDYYFNLFASGNVGAIKGVRKEHMNDIRQGIVRKGFNEAEVKLALGNPNRTLKTKKTTYSWVYPSAKNGSYSVVTFSLKNKEVLFVK